MPCFLELFFYFVWTTHHEKFKFDNCGLCNLAKIEMMEKWHIPETQIRCEPLFKTRPIIVQNEGWVIDYVVYRESNDGIEPTN